MAILGMAADRPTRGLLSLPEHLLLRVLCLTLDQGQRREEEGGASSSLSLHSLSVVSKEFYRLSRMLRSISAAGRGDERQGDEETSLSLNNFRSSLSELVQVIRQHKQPIQELSLSLILRPNDVGPSSLSFWEELVTSLSLLRSFSLEYHNFSSSASATSRSIPPWMGTNKVLDLLSRYCPRVTSLTLKGHAVQSQMYDTTLFEAWQSPQGKKKRLKLSVYGPTAEAFSLFLFRWKKANGGLRSLSLSRPLLGSDGFGDDFYGSLSHLAPSLEALDCPRTASNGPSPAVLRYFFENCRNLCRWELTSADFSPASASSLSFVQAMSSASIMGIRSLKLVETPIASLGEREREGVLPSNEALHRDIEALLRCCPALEELCIQGRDFMNAVTSDALLASLHAHCPRIRCLHAEEPTQDAESLFLSSLSDEGLLVMARMPNLKLAELPPSSRITGAGVARFISSALSSEATLSFGDVSSAKFEFSLALEVVRGLIRVDIAEEVKRQIERKRKSIIRMRQHEEEEINAIKREVLRCLRWKLQETYGTSMTLDWNLGEGADCISFSSEGKGEETQAEEKREEEPEVLPPELSTFPSPSISEDQEGWPHTCGTPFISPETPPTSLLLSASASPSPSTGLLASLPSFSLSSPPLSLPPPSFSLPQSYQCIGFYTYRSNRYAIEVKLTVGAGGALSGKGMDVFGSFKISGTLQSASSVAPLSAGSVYFEKDYGTYVVHYNGILKEERVTGRWELPSSQSQGEFDFILQEVDSQGSRSVIRNTVVSTWDGHFIQFGTEHPMSVHLMESTTRGGRKIMRGFGIDSIGPFSVYGAFYSVTDGAFTFSKAYKTHVISYEGVRVDGRMTGKWSLQNLSREFTLVLSSNIPVCGPC